jgi:phage baseplate assembly protein W
MPEYVDIHPAFVVHPVTRDFVVETDADAIKRSVRHLLLTSFFERPFQPGLGSRLRALLFEPLDDITERLMANEIHRVIETFEPRATLRAVTFMPSADTNSLSLTIEFTVHQLSTPVTLNLLLRRLR